jgi:hypothetical protein
MNALYSRTAAVAAVLFATLCSATAASKDVPAPLRDVVRRDFRRVLEVGVYPVSDRPDGPLDVVIVGVSKPPQWVSESYRAEVWRLHHNQRHKRWDSKSAAQGREFDVLDSDSFNVTHVGHGYKLTMQGNAAHGASLGFVVFSSETGRSYKARVANHSAPKYAVTYSPAIPNHAKQVLQGMMCQSGAISAKEALPFACPKTD